MGFIDKIKGNMSSYRKKQRSKRRAETLRLEAKNKFDREVKKEKLRFDRAKKESFENSLFGKVVKGAKSFVNEKKSSKNIRVGDQADKAFESGFFGGKDNQVYESGALKGLDSKKGKKDKFDDWF